VLKTVATRLVVIERRVPIDCAVCRTWCGIVLGDEDCNRTRPERCPDCGRLVPIRHVVIFVGVPLDAL
jgi:hypothetical protein